MASFGLLTTMPFFLEIKSLLSLIIAEALVTSKNFSYLLFAINVIVPDSALSIGETPSIIILGSPMTAPSIISAISDRLVKMKN